MQVGYPAFGTVFDCRTDNNNGGCFRGATFLNLIFLEHTTISSGGPLGPKPDNMTTKCAIRSTFDKNLTAEDIIGLSEVGEPRRSLVRLGAYLPHILLLMQVRGVAGICLDSW